MALPWLRSRAVVAVTSAGLLLTSAACGDRAGDVDAGPTYDAADAGLTPDVRLGSDAERPADATPLDAMPLDGAPTGPDAQVAPDVAANADAGAPAAPWAPFGLLSLNLHCLRLDGTPYTRHDDRFQAIAALVAREDVAVILAQEVCERPGLSARESLEAALEVATSTSWSSHWVYAHEAWVGTPDAAREGLAVFARGALSSPRSARYHIQGSLVRVLVAATLPRALGSLEVHSVHLDHAAPHVRAAQAAETVSYALSLSDPSLDVVVAGDLNAEVDSDTWRALVEGGFGDVAAPLGGIDHVLVHRGAAAEGSRPRHVFDGTREPRVSDHPGVLVQLAPRAAPLVARTRWTARTSAAEGRALALRGGTAPLSWTQGVWAWPVTPGEWRLVLTEVDVVPFEYKWLLDDLAWQTGANELGVGGTTHADTPAF